MERVRQAVAKAAGLAEERVDVHNHLLGGGFGRRLEPIWPMSRPASRSRSKGHSKSSGRAKRYPARYFQAAYHDRLSARLENGRIVGWQHRITGSAVIARFLPRSSEGVDPDGVDSAQDIPYDIPNLRVEFNRENRPA